MPKASSRKVGKSMTEIGGISAFGVDHGGGVSKREQPPASGERKAAGAIFGPYHAAVAGRKGKKLRATGRAAGYSLGGGVAGSAVEAGILGATRGKVKLHGALGSAGSVGGALQAVRVNQRKGYYKPEPKR